MCGHHIIATSCSFSCLRHEDVCSYRGKRSSVRRPDSQPAVSGLGCGRRRTRRRIRSMQAAWSGRIRLGRKGHDGRSHGQGVRKAQFLERARRCRCGHDGGGRACRMRAAGIRRGRRVRFRPDGCLGRPIRRGGRGLRLRRRGCGEVGGGGGRVRAAARQGSARSRRRQFALLRSDVHAQQRRRAGGARLLHGPVRDLAGARRRDGHVRQGPRRPQGRIRVLVRSERRRLPQRGSAESRIRLHVAGVSRASRFGQDFHDRAARGQLGRLYVASATRWRRGLERQDRRVVRVSRFSLGAGSSVEDRRGRRSPAWGREAADPREQRRGAHVRRVREQPRDDQRLSGIVALRPVGHVVQHGRRHPFGAGSRRGPVAHELLRGHDAVRRHVLSCRRGGARHDPASSRENLPR